MRTRLGHELTTNFAPLASSAAAEFFGWIRYLSNFWANFVGPSANELINEFERMNERTIMHILQLHIFILFAHSIIFKKGSPSVTGTEKDKIEINKRGKGEGLTDGFFDLREIRCRKRGTSNRTNAKI